MAGFHPGTGVQRTLILPAPVARYSRLSQTRPGSFRRKIHVRSPLPVAPLLSPVPNDLTESLMNPAGSQESLFARTLQQTPLWIPRRSSLILQQRVESHRLSPLTVAP